MSNPTQKNKYQALNARKLSIAKRRETIRVLALSFPAIIAVFAVIAVPMGWLFSLSFLDGSGQLSLVNYQKMFEYKSYLRVFRATFNVSFLTTFLCILIGYPLAYFLSQAPKKYVGIFMLAVLLPFWTSLLVRTTAWIVMLQQKGVINGVLVWLGIINDDQRIQMVYNMTGTIIAMTQILLPFMILPLYSVMKVIPKSHMRAAQNLGAKPVTAFLPRMCLHAYQLNVPSADAIYSHLNDMYVSKKIKFSIEKKFNFQFC